LRQEKEKQRELKVDDETQFTARMARISDKNRIAKLCRRAVGPHDYVLRILDEEIKDGGMFLVFSRKRDLIGMSKYTPVFDKSGWLGMARTDPDWRGRGVAQFLQRTIARHAKRNGINWLRFFVLSTNTPSLRAAKKGGFRVVADGSHVSSRLNSSTSKNALRAFSHFLRAGKDLRQSEENNDCDYETMIGSEYGRKMGGYMRTGYSFVRLNKSNLKSIEARGELFCEGNCSYILTRLEKDEGEFSILSGRPRLTLLRIMRKARDKGLVNLGGFVPYDRNLIRVCKRLGFKIDSWGKHMMLFEKRTYS
jgi:GNAT superfamily N-acetyltransferase